LGEVGLEGWRSKKTKEGVSKGESERVAKVRMKKVRVEDEFIEGNECSNC
jgi:hypothetical protein